jgi:SPP1 gp7 family putative phage head morphogenesis protein
MIVSRPDLLYALRLPPEEALRYLRRKGYAVTRSWLDLPTELHDIVFTVARVTAMEVLQDIKEALEEALAEGKTTRWFEQQVLEALQRRGWLPEAEAAGITKPWRLELILRTNLQRAYMAGRYRQQRENVDSRPYWQYVAVLDARTRPAHRALHGLVFRADDPFWDSHYPPNGFNCRCRVRALTADQVRRMGLEVQSSEGRLVEETRLLEGGEGPVEVRVRGLRMPDGSVAWTDPGWSTAPGAPWAPDMRRYFEELRRAAASRMPETAAARR